GSGIFIPYPDPPLLETRGAMYDIDIEDLNGDGYADLILIDTGAPNLIFLNNGDGRFVDGPAGTFSGDGDREVAWGDVDGDGDLDAVVASSSNNTTGRLYLNDGSGRFSTTPDQTLSGRTRTVALGDVDGDGDLDAVFGGDTPNRPQDNPVQIHLNDGQGHFSETPDLTLGNQLAADVTLGDIDG
ncbi:MAG: VCBS repeat-containing protein, partial [Anaerolineae bacterium]|nr:VCBS repeat-containing protein [Anaerolineae bacterium]